MELIFGRTVVLNLEYFLRIFVSSYFYSSKLPKREAEYDQARVDEFCIFFYYKNIQNFAVYYLLNHLNCAFGRKTASFQCLQHETHLNSHTFP